MGSLGKQGEATGEVEAGNWPSSRPVPQAPGCTLGSPARVSKLSPATCDACSIAHCATGSARLDSLDLCCLTRGSEVQPPPGQ